MSGAPSVPSRTQGNVCCGRRRGTRVEEGTESGPGGDRREEPWGFASLLALLPYHGFPRIHSFIQWVTISMVPCGFSQLCR